MPIYAIPKTIWSPNLRMVTDQSTGAFSLNSMISRDNICSYPLDNMKHLGEVLLETWRCLGHDVTLTLFKPDIAEAYQLLPVHPHWQIKQVNTLHGLRYVD